MSDCRRAAIGGEIDLWAARIVPAHDGREALADIKRDSDQGLRVVRDEKLGDRWIGWK